MEPEGKNQENVQNTIDTFIKFLNEKKDELTALQIIYTRAYRERQITYEQVKQLSEAIKKPPYNLSIDVLWESYEQLEKSKVRSVGTQKMLTNIIALTRFAMGESDVLESFSESINRNFKKWLQSQFPAGRFFSPEQLEWLKMIKDHIIVSVEMTMDDFSKTPFLEKGGIIIVHRLFGDDLNKILEELNHDLIIL